jgi:hypothetical protein
MIGTLRPVGSILIYTPSKIRAEVVGQFHDTENGREMDNRS